MEHAVLDGTEHLPIIQTARLHMSASEPNNIRLRLDLNPEPLANSILNHPDQLENFSRCPAAAVDDGQGVLRGEAGIAVCEAFVETGLLDEPGG